MSNDFLAFAGGVGANVSTQAEYAALTTLIANGFAAGIAESKKLNKVWRQSSIMAAVLAQFIVDQTGQNAVDDGTTATLLANLKTAIGSSTSRIATAGGSADAITATFSVVPTAFVNGLPYYVRAATANATTTPSFTPNSGTLAAKTIVKGNNLPLAVADIAGAGHWLELQYDSVLDVFVLLNPATGVTRVGATGGGTDKIFYLNDQTINNNYTVSGTQNAGSFGPITIASGVTVTIASGGVWTIV